MTYSFLYSAWLGNTGDSVQCLLKEFSDWQNNWISQMTFPLLMSIMYILIPVMKIIVAHW